MKNKIEQELDQKEFENDIGRDLKLGYEELDTRERLTKTTNKYAIAAIHFFGTLIICYTFYFLALFLYRIFFGAAVAMLGIDFSWISPIFHGAIWLAAIFSVYRKRSVLDDLLDRL